MRQLGGRLPEPPQLKTDVERLPEAEPQQQAQPEAQQQQSFAPQQAEPWLEPEPPAQQPQPEPQQQQPLAPQPHEEPAARPLAPHEAQQPQPYPVEVHRVERQPVASRPKPAPPSSSPAAEPVSVHPAEQVPPSPPAAVESANVRPVAPAPPSPPSPPRAAEQASARPAARAAVTREQPAGLRIMEAEAEPTPAGGRWEEFGDFRRLEPGRGGRINLEQMMGQPPDSRGMFRMEPEREHRSSFLTIAVPGIAAILAIGAIVWSGSLRDRLHQQDEQMTSLQEQNRKLADKLADSLAEGGSDQKSTDALNPDSAPSSAPTSTPAQPNVSNPPANSTPPPTAEDKAQPAQSQSTPLAQALSNQPAQPQSASAAPPPKQPAQTAEKREGVSVPPPTRASAQRSFPRGTVDPNYHPMIVPPYPTNSAAETMGAGTPSQSAPSQQAYREPFPVNGSSHASASPAASSRTAQLYGTSQPAGANSVAGQSSGSLPAYTASSNGMYASALAQNIEAVQTLQRQSTVPLREFHGSDGVPARILPGLAISVRSPDQARGTYALVVNSGGANYQLRGRVNSAVAFTDNATHRGYELVILHIAGGQAYGYVRPVQ
jgi:hypothetical protein